jgi:hypothetical protein
MPTRTGAYLAVQRRTQHLSPQRLAAALGYTNLTKGARRILRSNATAMPSTDCWTTSSTSSDWTTTSCMPWSPRTAGSSKRPGNTGPANPLNRNCGRRLMAAIWGRAQMPKGLSREEAVAFAKTRAVKSRLTYVLVWSRNEEIWCYPDGSSGVVTMKVGEAAGPFTRLRGRGNRGFIFG